MDKGIRYKNISIVFLLTLCLIVSLFTYIVASPKSPQLAVYASDGIITLATGDFNSAAVKTDADVLKILNKLKDTYGYENAESELTLDKTVDTAFGKVFRFNQVKNGLTVFGRGLNISVNRKGEVLSISGNYLKGIKIQLNPKLNEEDAAIEIFNTYTQAQINSVNLEIYSLNDLRPVLAYNTVAVINGALTRVFISADTGLIIEEIPLESNHLPPNYNTTIVRNTTQKDYYGQNKSVDIERQNLYYFLNDAYRNIILYDCENTDQPKNYIYSSNQTFNNGLAVTALTNTVKAFDFYTDENNIGTSTSGIDGSVDGTHRGQEAFVIVCLHYGEELQNAFCSFDPDYIDDTFGRYMYLIFGDGHPSGFYNPVVSSDVVGHEYQHAVTSYNAGLIYLNASGALNEAYSDIFGALIENYEQADDNFWIIGEDSTADKKGLRSMKNPIAYGYPDHMDNMYPMDGNYDQGGVHYNSAIITHAQYKMYESLPNHFTKQNIGLLWYSALPLLSPDSDFSDFKIIMRQTAAQLEWNESVLNIMDEAFESCGIKGTEGEHTISFNKGGMTGAAPMDIALNYGETFIIPACTLTASRAKLAGWSETGNYKSTVYLAGEEYKMPAFDITLYPVLEREIWNGIEPTVLQGQGTQNSPYLINTAEDLATVAYYFNNDVNKPWGESLNPHFLMTADIDLRGIPWIPIKNYNAETKASEEKINFDGGGHVILRLNIFYENPDKFVDQGLFGTVDNINILRLGIESGNIETASMYVGAIAGCIRFGNIKDCFSKIDVTNTASVINYMGGLTYGSAGGLVGYFRGEANMTNCYNQGNVSGYYAGGVCAVEYDGVVFNGCSNRGSVSGMMMGGGIVGYSTHLNIINCINTGAVTGISSYIGGICGALYAEKDSESIIAGCKNTGLLSGWFRGGLIGFMMGECTILLDKNHYASQDSVTYIGNLESIKDKITVSGDAPICSDDALNEGDFAFNSIEYFLNEDYFDGVSDESALRLYFSMGNANSFTVTWDIDGETQTENYEFGTMPEYSGETPVKATDAQYSYTFKGWSPSVAAVKGNITYTAVFEQTVNNYTVTFMSDGQAIDTRIVAYGGKLTDLPTATKNGFIFKGWYRDEDCKSVFNKDNDTIFSNITLYAKWEEKTIGCGCGTIDFSFPAIIFFMLTLTAMVCFIKPRRLKKEQS